MRRQLSIIICTKDRPEDLCRAVESVVRAVKWCPGDFEVIIIDDGNLAPCLRDHIRNVLEDASIPLKYYNKRGNLGLFASRLKGLEFAEYEFVLFIDDDVEIHHDYIARLFDTLETYPQAVGVGGVDVLMKPVPRWRQLWEVVILYRSLDPGKLSISGFGGNMDQWNAAVSPFPSEFLSGCNMCFRKKALKGATQKDWLQGYSLGEDLYLSFVVRQSGELIVNPHMKVKHHRSRMSRDSAATVAYTQIVNHYKLLCEYKAPRYRACALLWTAVGLVVLHTLGGLLGRPAGWKRAGRAIRGLLHVCREMFTQAARRSG